MTQFDPVEAPLSVQVSVGGSLSSDESKTQKSCLQPVIETGLLGKHADEPNLPGLVIENQSSIHTQKLVVARLVTEHTNQPRAKRKRNIDVLLPGRQRIERSDYSGANHAEPVVNRVFAIQPERALIAGV